MQIEGDTGGDGVAPRDVRVVPDRHGRRSEQRTARHIQLPGDGLLRLPEPPPALPRVVWIAQQQPTPVRRRTAAERDRVGAHVRVLRGQQPLRRLRGVVRRDTWRRGRARGRLSRCDAVDTAALTAQHGEREGAGRDIQGRHRPHPVGIPAGRISDPVLGQPGVVPGRPAALQLLHLMALTRRSGHLQQFLDGVAVAYPAEVEIAGEILRRGGQRAVRRRVRTEVPRPLAAQRHEAVGERAHLVGGLRPAVAEPEIRVVLRHDVRDAVLGVADHGGQPAARRVLAVRGIGGRRWQGRRHGEQSETGHRKKSQTVSEGQGSSQLCVHERRLLGSSETPRATQPAPAYPCQHRGRDPNP